MNLIDSLRQTKQIAPVKGLIMRSFLAMVGKQVLCLAFIVSSICLGSAIYYYFTGNVARSYGVIITLLACGAAYIIYLCIKIYLISQEEPYNLLDKLLILPYPFLIKCAYKSLFHKRSFMFKILSTLVIYWVFRSLYKSYGRSLLPLMRNNLLK